MLRTNSCVLIRSATENIFRPDVEQFECSWRNLLFFHDHVLMSKQFQSIGKAFPTGPRCCAEFCVKAGYFLARVFQSGAESTNRQACVVCLSVRSSETDGWIVTAGSGIKRSWCRKAGNVSAETRAEN